MSSRRVSTVDNAASIPTRLQPPPRIRRQLDKATRVLATDAEAARRQRQFDALVLTQIVSRAERIRRRARLHGKTPSGRTLDESRDDEANAWSAATPLTLIELIQASGAVLDKRGIRPPQDAAYHRVLLTLSMDPERDWKSKIQRFAVAQQPRVMRMAGDSVVGGVGGGVLSPRERRASVVSEASMKTPARRPTNASERVGTPRMESAKRTERQPTDRFGDVLVASSSKAGKATKASFVTSKENQVRNASGEEMEDRKEKKMEGKATVEEKLRELWRMRAKLEDLTEELGIGNDDKDEDQEEDGDQEEEEEEEEEEDDSVEDQLRQLRRLREIQREVDDADDDVVPQQASWSDGGGDSTPSSPVLEKIVPVQMARIPAPQPTRRVSMATFQLLATSFQQWKELMAFHRLVRESRQREMRLTQSILPPAATFAVFRWIALSLEPCNTVSRGENRAIPTFVVSRGVAVANSPLLRHFTGRLLVWTLRRIIQTWAKDARIKKTVRIKSMIRQRTQVLETTVECMRQWQAYAKRRKRVRDHGVWVETLHGRRCLRLRMRLWRAALETQRRNTKISATYGHKIVRKVFSLWSQLAKRRRQASSLGSRARLKRLLRDWRQATKALSEEDRIGARADALYARRVLKKCWAPWKARCKDSSAKREKLVKWNRSRCVNMKRLWWEAWKQIHARRRSLHQKYARFVRRRTWRDIRRVVDAWAAYTQRRRQCELLMMDAVGRLEEKQLQRVWLVWMNHSRMTVYEDDGKIQKLEAKRRAEIWRSWKRQTSTRRVLTKLRVYSDHGLSAAVWRNWRAFVQRQKHYRAVVETWGGERQQTTKLRVFEALAENWKSSHTKQQVARVFTGQGNKKRLQLCLWAWQEVGISRRDQHQRDADIVKTWRRSRVDQLWRVWRQAFHVAQCVHLADRSMAKGLRRRYWTSWCNYVRSKRDKAVINQKLQAFRLRRALLQWHDQVKTKRSMLKLQATVAARCQQYLLVKSWRGWTSSFSMVRARHIRVAQAVSQWRNRQVAASFHAWKAVHLKRKEHKLTLASWWQAARDRGVRACWKAWCLYVEHRHERRQALEDAAQHHTQLSLRRSINHWRFCCEHSQEKLQVMNRCLEVWKSNQRRQKFLRWKSYTHDRHRNRKVDGIFRAKRMAKAFRLWIQWKAARDSRLEEYAHATSLLHQWKVKYGLRKLRFNALALKRVSSIVGLIKIAGSRGQQVVFFRRWRAFVGMRKQQRAEFQSSTRELQRFRLQRSVQTWSSFLRVKRLLSSTLLRVKARTSTAVVTRIYRKWQQFVADRKLFHTLQQKALVFRVFCVLPIYFFAWKKYVSDQGHRKQLILRASRLLCHHREARAFKAWNAFTILKQRSRKALATWRNQTLIQIFRRWKGLRVIQQAKARAIRLYETTMRRRVLCEWRGDAHRKRLLRHFTQMWHAQTTQTSFRLWSKHTKTKRCARILLTRLQNASLGRVFNSWKSLIQSQVQLSAGIQQRFVLLWNQDRQMTGFQRWKALTEQQKMLKARMRRRLQQQSVECFVRWRDLVVKAKKLKQQASDVACQRQRSVMRESWTLWRRQKYARDAVNGLRNRVLNRTSDAFIKRLLCEWRGVVAKSRLVNAMFSRLSNAVVGRVFTAWRHKYVAQRREERRLAAQVHRLWAQRVLGGVLKKMKSRVALKRTCVKVFLPLIQRHVLSKTWLAWCEYHTQKQETKTLVAKLQKELIHSDLATASLVSASIRRWRAPVQARCLSHWLVMARYQKWMRAQTAAALQFWQTRQCRVFFTEWNEWRDRHKWKRSIASRNASHRRIRAWRRWISYHKQQRLKALTREKATQLRKKRIQVSVIYAWRQHLTMQRHCKLVEAALTLRRTRRSLGEWHERTVEMRAHRLQLTVASVAFNHKTLVAVWRQWTEYVRLVRSHREELQQYTERLQVLVLCSTFRAWRSWSHRQHRINNVVALLSGRCSNRTAQFVVHAWLRFAKTGKERRDRADSFAYATTARRGVKALQNCVHLRKSHENAVLRARKWTDLLHSRHAERVFRRWKRFAWLSRESKRVTHRYNTQKLLPSVLAVWTTFSLTCHHKRERLSKALNYWQSIYTRRAWTAWACYRLMRLKARQAKLTAQEFRIRRQLTCVLLAWRASVVKKKLVGESCRKLLVRWRMQTAYRCFMSWQSFSLHRKTLHVSSAIVTRQLITGSLRTAWSEWRRQFIVVRVGKRKQLLRAWSRWMQWRSDRHEWRQFQSQQQLVLLQTVRARHGIRQWRQFVVQAKMAKTLAVLSSRFQKDTLVKRVFERWLEFLVVQHKEKDKMKRVLVWFHQRQLMQTFQALCSHARYQKAKQEQLVKALQHHRRRVVFTVLREWRRTALVVTQQRLKLRQYVDVMQHLSQRKSFVAWRDFASRRVELKATCAALLSQRTLLTTQSVLQQWQRFVAKAKAKKLAESLCETRLFRSSLRQWHSFVVLTKMERMLGASEQRLLERGFLEWRKKATLGKSTRLLSEQREKREAQSYLLKMFKAWSQWSRIQAKCSNLLANVAVGNHLRFRFLMWKQFTSKKVRLKRLVHGLQSHESTLSETVAASTIGETDTNDSAVVEVSPSRQLARMARFFQRFEVEWSDVSVVWQRWRHVFHARLFYRMRRLHKCFVAWQKWSQRRRFVQKTLSTRLQSQRQTRVKAVLDAWRHVVGTVKQIQRERRRERELWVIVNTEILRRERKTLQKHWNAWRERVEDKQHLLVSVGTYQRARILTKFWLLWSHDFVSVVKRERREDVRRLEVINKVKLVRAVRKMNEYARRHRQVRSSLDKLKLQRETRLRGVCFEAWQTKTTVRRRVRLLSAFKKRQRLRNAMALWVKWLDARHQQQREIGQFVHQRETAARLRVFNRWRKYQQDRQQKTEMKAVAMDFRLRHLVHKRWRRTIQQRLCTRAKREAAQVALVAWKQQRSITKWHRAARDASLQRKLRRFVLRKVMALWKSDTQFTIAVRFATFHCQKQAKRVLCEWHARTARRAWRRRLQLEAVDAQKTRVSRRVWSCWLAFMETKRKRRLANSHYDAVVKIKWLLHWFDATKELKWQRDERLCEANGLHGRHIAGRAVRAWTLAIQSNQQRRAVLLICMVKLQRALHSRVQQVVLRAWAEAADSMRYARECGEVLEQSRLRRDLLRWQSSIADRKRREQRQRDAVAYHRQRLLAVRFFQWQNYALAWKDAKRVKRPTATRRVTPPPPPIQMTRAVRRVDEEEEEEEDVGFRHPLSPIAKRFQAKKQAKMLHEELEDDSTPQVPSFADAASLSLDVKKRLMVLGKWKPAHKSLHQA